MDSSGTLWLLEVNKLPVRLGYSEFFQDFVGTDVIISYDHDQSEFFISNGWKSFVLTNNGLGRNSQILTSVINYESRPVGIGTYPNNMNKEASIVTDSFDFGNSMIKTITSVEMSFRTEWKGVSVAIDYRYNRNEDFKRSLWKTIPEISNRAFMRFPVSGVEFRVAVKFEDFELTEPPDRLTVTWQQSDRTNIRTRVYADTTVKQSDF
jgi:hypothetical protein